MIQKFLIFLIKSYQTFISPYLGENCRFFPSCSEYSLKAIKKYGTRKGLIISLKRILRCHPFSCGGIDEP